MHSSSWSSTCSRWPKHGRHQNSSRSQSCKHVGRVRFVAHRSWQGQGGEAVAAAPAADCWGQGSTKFQASPTWYGSDNYAEATVRCTLIACLTECVSTGQGCLVPRGWTGCQGLQQHSPMQLWNFHHPRGHTAQQHMSSSTCSRFTRHQQHQPDQHLWLLCLQEGSSCCCVEASSGSV